MFAVGITLAPIVAGLVASTAWALVEPKSLGSVEAGYPTAVPIRSRS